MSLPDVTQTFTDGALGIQAPSFARTQAKIGVASKAVAGTVYQFSDLKQMVTTMGRGSMVDAASAILGLPNTGPVIMVAAVPDVAGSVNGGTMTQTGTGSGTVTISTALAETVAIKIIAGGALATMTYQVSVNGGAYGPTQTSAAAPNNTYRPPGAEFVLLTFTAGTYVTDDVFSIATTGTVTRTGSGTATLLNGSTYDPLDSYAVVVSIVTAGALGAAVFKYSLDGGTTYSGNILVPGGGVYVVPNAGIKLTFASTFVAGDSYALAVTGPGASSSSLQAAFDLLVADPRKWALVHVVGMPANAAAAASLEGSFNSKMATVEALFRYARCVIECPTSESDATLIAAFASVASTEGRVSVCAGDVALVSPLTGLTERRNVAWAYCARLAQINPGESPGWVGRGALPNVTSLYRDEAVTSGLNDARFVTARSFPGLAGYYITDGPTMATAGSDFGFIMGCRVMDIVADTTRARLLKYVNASVRVDRTTGYIDKRDALRIEADITAGVRDAVVATGDASDAKVILNRTTNLLSTSTEPVTTRVLPLAYLKYIQNDLGFLNPANA